MTERQLGREEAVWRGAGLAMVSLRGNMCIGDWGRASRIVEAARGVGRVPTENNSSRLTGPLSGSRQAPKKLFSLNLLPWLLLGCHFFSNKIQRAVLHPFIHSLPLLLS